MLPRILARSLRLAVATLAVCSAACGVSSSGTTSSTSATSCTYTYSDWQPAICPMRGTQTRTVSAPAAPGCTGSPIVTQTCARPGSWVWFTPLDPTPRANFTGSPQYMQLFSVQAPWAVAAARTAVFKIYAGLLENMPDADLRTIFDDLNRRGIELALEYGVLGETDACGRGVEGFGGRLLVTAARRIASLGGTLRYVAMDEPFYYGGIDSGTNACRWTSAQIASDAAISIRALKAEFPNVEIGDIEPVPVGDAADWLVRYTTAIDALAGLGVPLAFMHADVLWSDPFWRTGVDALRTATAARRIPYGVIYNGDGTDTSDLQWLGHAESRMVEYELGSGVPENAVFQSWHPYPQKLLPEADADSFTSLINRYRRVRTATTATRAGDVVQGTLRLVSGEPVSHATIAITARAVTGLGLTATYDTTGQIPAGTTAMLVGARVNTQCSGCLGQADLLVSSFRVDVAGRSFVQDFTGGLSGWTVSNPSTVSLEGSALRVMASLFQKLALTSAPMAITGGGDFHLSVVARVSPASLGTGYFTVIFANAAGEISRAEIPFEAAKVLLATGLTAADGTWQVSIHSSGLGDAEIWADYAGDAATWPARALATTAVAPASRR